MINNTLSQKKIIHKNLILVDNSVWLIEFLKVEIQNGQSNTILIGNLK